METFALFEIPLPGGGTIAISPLPGRTGRFAADLQRMIAWRPDIVVSMTEDAEVSGQSAADLAARLRGHAIAHANFPVCDYGTPNGSDAPWQAISERLRAILDRDGRVLLHCMGGKGRSGMIAMRLACERGINPSQALAMIRAARSGAVETEEQRLWATAGYTAPEPH